MYSKVLSATALALAAAGLASGQTSSACNPALGAHCAPDTAAPATTVVDFTQGASDFFTLAEGTTLTYDGANGAAFTINQETQAPTITSNDYIFFGKIDVWVRAASGTGIVTSFVLLSDDLDEIDWEWLGGDTTQVQTNYFSKGDTSTFNRGGFSSVAIPQTEFHKYTIDWTNSSLTWLIDDVVTRVLTYDDADGGATFPQTPMQIKLGTWDGGSSTSPPGTVEWAGGLTDFAAAPFIGFYQKLNIINYSNGVSGATDYVYNGASGTFGSILINTSGGSSGGSTGGSSGSASSSSPNPSKSSSENTASMWPSTTSSTAATTSSHSTSSHSTVKATTSSNSTGTSGVAGSTGAGTSGNSGATPTGNTSSTSATSAPNTAGNVAATLGNVVAAAAAVFLGSLVL